MSDVELTDAESRRLLFASGGGRRFDEVAAEVRTILAARLSQEREQVRAERDQEWQRHLNALPDEMAEAWGGDAAWLTTGSKVATLVGDWLADLHYDLAQDGPRPAQEGER